MYSIIENKELFTYCNSASGELYTIAEPATGGKLGVFKKHTRSDFDHILVAASEAQTEWKSVSYKIRSRCLKDAADSLEKHREEAEYWLIREAGSSKVKAREEVNASILRLHSASALPLVPYGSLLQNDKSPLSFTRRLPLGLVGVITPFNFPLLLAIRSVAPAIATGNSVILKPDLRTSISGGFILSKIFSETCLPKDAFNLLLGGRGIAEYLTSSNQVDAVSFTGSTVAGRSVAENSISNFKKIHLELGGNNALLVTSSANIELSINAACWGSFLHQGQICMSVGRHIVHESLYNRYVEGLTKKAKALSVGDGFTTDCSLGPVIDIHQRNKIHKLVTNSLSNGGIIRTGGSYRDLFYRPTVISDVDFHDDIFTDEIFGPVAVITKYSTIEEAIEIINASRYGLSLGILTTDVMGALELSDKVKVGSLHINDQTIGASETSPTGGIGLSGNGARFGGIEADLDAFTDKQWVTMSGSIPSYSI